ncbi:hypothetical protein [Legionella longbeachae]|uniref:hypothetical protein n=1 Tax=Legionella longbeachae TaxID=450 RepID=UPI00124758D0|nr:hypothetical protein [Legionella longbeachae]QEY51822.1 hypothetical protein FQU71_11580 [Legionella longbeachae]
MSIWQGNIIETINAYLEEHPTPIRLNTSGICRGLSILHAKYILDGKEKEFEELLKLLAGEPEISLRNENEIDQKIYNFLTNLIEVHNPREDHRYAKSYAESYEQFFIGKDSKPIKSMYKLGMVTTPENWASIFQELDLKNDEVMLVGSTRHGISIIKSDSTYKIYDPNNPMLYKEFSADNLREMMEYLQNTTFRYKEEDNCLGLSLNIVSIKNPDMRSFPSKDSFYEKFFSKDQDKVSYKKDGYTETSLIFAARVSDKDSVDLLLNQNPPKKEDILEAAILTIQYGNSYVLPSLVTSLKNMGDKFTVNDKKSLVNNGISFGSLEMLKTLLEEPSINEAYQAFLKRLPGDFLNLSLKGGNPDVISKALDDIFCEKEIPEIFEALQTMIGNPEEDIFLRAINSQNPKALEVLCQKLKTYPQGKDLIENLKNNPDYLAQSIKNNNPGMVRTLLEEFNFQTDNDKDHECINTISLSLSAVNKTDITLLRTLETYGMEFSTTSKNLMDKKESLKIGVLAQFGIALMSFSEFLKRHILRKTEEIRLKNTTNPTPVGHDQSNPDLSSSPIIIQFDEEEDNDKSEMKDNSLVEPVHSNPELPSSSTEERKAKKNIVIQFEDDDEEEEDKSEMKDASLVESIHSNPELSSLSTEEPMSKEEKPYQQFPQSAQANKAFYDFKKEFNSIVESRKDINKDKEPEALSFSSP